MASEKVAPEKHAAGSMAKRIEHWAIMLLFLAVLWLPMLIQPTGWDPAASLGRGEKRNPVPFPAWSGPDWSLRGFTRGLEAWCDDHFGLRRTMITANSLLDYFVFGVSPNPSVVPGKEGWLFYAGDARGEDGNPIWDVRAARPLSPYALERIRWMLQDQHEWLAARNIPYIFVIVPTKEEIHGSYLPAHITRVGELTPREQLLRHLAEWAPSVPLLDLTPALLDKARHEPCFHKTDTHWNAIGGMVGAQNILARLQHDFPAITQPRDEDYQRSTKRDLGGDLAAQMALDSFLLEDYTALLPLHKPRSQPRPLHDGEDPDIEARTGDPSLPRAVIYRDSYSNILVPTLSEHFQWVRFVWGRTGTEMPGIEAIKPDVVLQIMSDRALRLPLRYSAAMQRDCLLERFETSHDILLSQTGPDAVSAVIAPAPEVECEIRHDDIIMSSASGNLAFEIPGLDKAPSKQLPILRLRLFSPQAGNLYASWRNSRTGEQVDDRINVRRGANDILLPLYDPEFSGNLRLSLPARAKKIALRSIEARAFPR